MYLHRSLTMPSIGTLNEEGVNVDLYIPRKCHASNTLITAYDFASIQINVGEIDANGVYTGETKTLCIAGYLRHEAESDHAINRLCITHGIIRPRTARPKKQKKAKPTAAVKRPVAKAPAKGGKPAPKGGKPAPRGAPRPKTAPAAAKGGKGAPKPAGDKPAGDRPAKPAGERRPKTAAGEKKPAGDKPAGDKPAGDKPARKPAPKKQ